jgi:hypothetical protein
MWTYKDLKDIPSQIVQHKIELDTIVIYSSSEVLVESYYITAMKQDIDKLFLVAFIKLVEEAT